MIISKEFKQLNIKDFYLIKEYTSGLLFKHIKELKRGIASFFIVYY